jgi:hypothetical protein
VEQSFFMISFEKVVGLFSLQLSIYKGLACQGFKRTLFQQMRGHNRLTIEDKVGEEAVEPSHRSRRVVNEPDRAGCTNLSLF